MENEKMKKEKIKKFCIPSAKAEFSVLSLLVALIIVLATSAGVFFLVRTGVLPVAPQQQGQEERLILPIQEAVQLPKENALKITEIKLCEQVNLHLDCINEKTAFKRGETVYFTLLVETTVISNNVRLIANFGINDENGKPILAVEEQNEFPISAKSIGKTEQLRLQNSFTFEESDQPGAYILEIVVANPLINKKASKTKEFMIE